MAKENNFDSILDQTKQLFKAKKYQEIIDLLDNDLLDKFKNAELYSYRARAESWFENEACFHYAEKAIKADPDYPYSYLARGNYWTDKKEYEKAISDFTRSIGIFLTPNHHH